MEQSFSARTTPAARWSRATWSRSCAWWAAARLALPRSKGPAQQHLAPAEFRELGRDLAQAGQPENAAPEHVRHRPLPEKEEDQEDREAAHGGSLHPRFPGKPG